MNDRIDLTGIEVLARHGVLPEEKIKEQRFVIDLTVHYDSSEAALSDDVGRTIDYGELAQLVHDAVAATSRDLIEKVADDVARTVLAVQRVERVVVTVHKPEAPIPVPFDDVSVTIDRSQ